MEKFLKKILGGSMEKILWNCRIEWNCPLDVEGNCSGEIAGRKMNTFQEECPEQLCRNSWRDSEGIFREIPDAF